MNEALKTVIDEIKKMDMADKINAINEIKQELKRVLMYQQIKFFLIQTHSLQYLLLWMMHLELKTLQQEEKL